MSLISEIISFLQAIASNTIAFAADEKVPSIDFLLNDWIHCRRDAGNRTTHHIVDQENEHKPNHVLVDAFADTFHFQLADTPITLR